MLTIQADVRITRRKTMAFVLDEREQVMWSGKSFAHALAWCLEAGYTTVRVVAPTGVIYIEIIPVHNGEVDADD